MSDERHITPSPSSGGLRYFGRGRDKSRAQLLYDNQEKYFQSKLAYILNQFMLFYIEHKNET